MTPEKGNDARHAWGSATGAHAAPKQRNQTERPNSHGNGTQSGAAQRNASERDKEHNRRESVRLGVVSLRVECAVGYGTGVQ